MAEVVQNEEHSKLIEETRYQSAAVAPLVARGNDAGGDLLPPCQHRHALRREDLQLLGELADRAALALDNARLYEERDRIAQNLQRGLRPPEPPYVAGPRHRPSSSTPSARGWRSAATSTTSCPTEDGCWIMIGDVTGKGSVAAGVSVALRHSMRGLARQIDEPEELLAQLNEMLLEGSSLNDFATAVLLRLRREGERWSFSLAAAGHPPAIHVTDERAGAARRRRRPRRLGRLAACRSTKGNCGRGDAGPRHRRLVRGRAARDPRRRRRSSARWLTPSPISSSAR